MIFEPFVRVEGTAQHKKGGTGLGLAIAQAVVVEHGTRIRVDDQPGGGARFSFELPF